MITREEFDQWREWLRTEASIHPPEIITANYWDWSCRASLARFMMRDQIFEPALRIMETVVEQIPDGDDHYAWALSDLGCLHWRVNRDYVEAVQLINQALEVLDNTEQNREEMSFFSEGGKYLSYKLEIMEQAGELEKAKEEAVKEIERYRQKYPDVKQNSYLFNGYLFLAKVKKDQQHYPEAIGYMKKALAASEYAEKCKQICDTNIEDLEMLYEKLYRLSFSMITYFEV
ncbi:hypothetical protein [Neobacillus sp. Marseille-QA0830]